MGHLRLDRLPRTHRWKQVMELAALGAPVEELAEATYWAAYSGLGRVPQLGDVRRMKSEGS